MHVHHQNAGQKNNIYKGNNTLKNEATFKYVGNMGNKRGDLQIFGKCGKQMRQLSNIWGIWETINFTFMMLKAKYIQGMLAYNSLQNIRYFICYLEM
jgi:hypothetical protein